MSSTCKWNGDDGRNNLYAISFIGPKLKKEHQLTISSGRSNNWVSQNWPWVVRHMGQLGQLHVISEYNFIYTPAYQSVQGVARQQGTFQDKPWFTSWLPKGLTARKQKGLQLFIVRKRRHGSHYSIPPGKTAISREFSRTLNSETPILILLA